MACLIYVAGEMMTIDQVVAHAVTGRKTPDPAKKDVPWVLQATLDLASLEKDSSGVPDPVKVKALDDFLDAFTNATVVAVARSTG